MRSISFALSFILAFSPAYSQSPPPSVKGQDQTGSYLPKPNIVVPHRQATNLGGLNVLLETGNKNILVNPGFESSTLGEGWTTVNGTPSIETTEVRDGKRSYQNDFTSVNGILVQQEVTPTQNVGGMNYEFSAWVYTTTTNTEFCSLIDGAVIQCSAIPQNTWTKVVLNAPAVSGDSHGVRVRTTASVSGTIYLDDAYVGPATNIGTVAQAQVVVRARGVPTGPLDGSGSTIWGTEDEDVYNAYNSSTGAFTAPFGGRFCWNAAVKLTGTETSDNYIALTPYIGTSAQSAYNGLYRLEGSGLTDQQVQTNACLNLTAGQVLSFRTETNIGSAAFGSSSSNYLVIKSYPSPQQVVQTANLPAGPTVTRLTSGSGTYTPPVGVKWLEIEMVGGGGGGGGSGTSVTGGDGGDGTNSTFGTSLLTAPRGLGGAKSGSAIGGSAGGAATVNAPAVIRFTIEGERGRPGFPGGISYMPGGDGGSSYFGGAGAGIFNANAGPGRTNSGSGGAGAGTGADSTPGGAGGGAGGTYLRAYIPAGSVAASYAYTVGTGGAAGTAGTSGFAGGAGGSGVIIITEHYGTDNMPLYMGSVMSGSSGVTRVESARISCAAASSVTSVTGNWLSLGNYSSGACVMTMSGFSATPSCTANAGGTSTATTEAIKVQMTSATAATLTCISNNAGTTAACGDPWTGTVTCIGPK